MTPPQRFADRFRLSIKIDAPAISVGNTSFNEGYSYPLVDLLIRLSRCDMMCIYYGGAVSLGHRIGSVQHFVLLADDCHFNQAEFAQAMLPK